MKQSFVYLEVEELMIIIYIGLWEDEDDFIHGGENVNYLFEIIFNDSDDF